MLAAAGDLARALLAGQQPPDVWQLIATQARQATMAAVALVGSSTDGTWLTVEVAAGLGTDQLCGQRLRLAPLPLAGSTRDATSARNPAGTHHPCSLSLPLGCTPDGARTVLVVLGLPAVGRAAATRSLRAFADQAAQALQLAGQRVAGERERLLQDRERTATSLLTLVIPQLFAAGLRLAGTDGLIADQPTQARARLHQAVDDVDIAIVQVRAAAFGLRPTSSAPSGTPGAVPAAAG